MKQFLEQYGIKIEQIKDIDEIVGENESIKNIDKLDSEWHAVFHEPRPKTKKECLDVLIEIACGLQSVICESADLIKITNAQTVEDECKVKRGHFVKAVNINASPNKEKQKEKIKKNSQEISEVIDNV